MRQTVQEFVEHLAGQYQRSRVDVRVKVGAARVIYRCINIHFCLLFVIIQEAKG